MEESKLIHEFQKNANEKVRVEFCRFNNHDLLNLRVFFQSEDNKWLPTRKGLTIRPDLLDDLKEAVDKAHKEWQRRIYNPN